MTRCVVCSHPLEPYPVKVTARPMCWDEVACRARARQMKGAAVAARRKTLIEIEHHASVEPRHIMDHVRERLRTTLCVFAVLAAPADTIETDFLLRVEHDVEYTPGDMAHQIRRALEAAEITCLVCERQGGACCEYGPDAA